MEAGRGRQVWEEALPFPLCAASPTWQPAAFPAASGCADGGRDEAAGGTWGPTLHEAGVREVRVRTRVGAGEGDPLSSSGRSPPAGQSLHQLRVEESS